MKKSFNTTVSVKDGTSRSVLKGIVQHDTLNEVNIRLTDGTRPFDYTGYTNIILKVRKADGTSYVDSEGNSVIATNPSGGLITVLLKGQATAAVGLCQCVIEIYADGEKMTTARLNYEVSDALGTGEDAASESQYPAFQKLLSDLSKIEADATAAGGYATRAEIAANKAELWAQTTRNIVDGDFATRTELEAVKAGAAPAGFGLGTKVAIAPLNSDGYADANLITQTGIYSAIANLNGVGWCYVLHMAYTSPAAARQDAWSVNDHEKHMVRNKNGDSWSDWEWVNPPMMLGVEYRTTERFMGKPVYSKLVDFGELPNATTKTVDAGFGSGYIISIESIFSNNQGYCFYKDENITRVSAAGSKISITTSSSMSVYAVMVLVKYYKTTD